MNFIARLCCSLRDGREVFYASSGNPSTMYAVEVTTDARLSAKLP